MFAAVKFLRHVRVPLAAAFTSTPARFPRSGNFDCIKKCLKLGGGKSQLLFTVTKSSYKIFDLQKFNQYAQKLLDSGRKFASGNVVVCAVLGTMSLWPRNAYCADGFFTLLDDPRAISPGASRSEENLRRVIILLSKLLVPLFLFVTVWVNWGQSHPVFLAAKVALIFLSTKPFPSAVYIFVDQLRCQIMSQHPFLYRFKPLQAKRVEVEDYTFLCVARVEIKDDQLVLIGILGSWWILPLTSQNEVFLFHKSSWNELISLVKRRFRLGG